MSNINEVLCDCLYFSCNKLSRTLGKMADEEFRITGLSSTYAFLISIVHENEGIGQKEIGQILHITPSTTTRFIDKLENKGLLNRKSEGKNSFIYLTDKGLELQAQINKAWENLHLRCLNALGENEYKSLTKIINNTCNKIDSYEK
ncbi:MULTISPECIES: MarR family winged helix-turn-helix transcriptional regulator [Clostridium]|uniref:MarR family winged helix-turn-helix transcriptional regulator n=1 Tax=Clostridium TaxID=1485 RepID=UPI00069F52FE|nr:MULTISPECIES: MarR family transcriptional regulator [Clostridium]KOF55613.1 MarR family transcriptional regulator [Clostridium sp. DMHC 10]MCD2346356.1 MarR family transcriptional regulator [Clostridium guangxiense]